MRRFGTAAAALVLALGAVACSDSDSGSDGGGEGASSEKGQEYADAITGRIGSAPGIPEKSTQCFASALVEGIGLDELEDRGTPEELADQDEAFADMTLDEPQAEAAYEHLETCVDPREFLVQTILSGAEMSDEAASCVDEAVDDEAARESFVTGFQGPEAQRQSEGMQEMTSAVNQCLMVDLPAPPSQPGDADEPSQPDGGGPSTTAP